MLRRGGASDQREPCVWRVIHRIRRAAEILVVDNHSGDGSAEWLPSKFPTVQFILNKENLGFAAANNQALNRARGKYILFLNPDTILPEDYFHLASLLYGIRSRSRSRRPRAFRIRDRGRPLFKRIQTGLSRAMGCILQVIRIGSHLFPRSALHSPDTILAICRRTGTWPLPYSRAPACSCEETALERTGGFDETDSMYAEDIDLSHRIQQAGYANYYIAAATILHFKGESTKKDTRYVKLFYKAMSQFRQKHFREGVSGAMNVQMEMAIWLLAGITAIANLFRRVVVAEKSSQQWLWIAGDPANANRLKAALT